MLSLQWKQVDFQAGIIRLEPGTTKNAEARTFPFTRKFQEILERQKTQSNDLANEKGIICPSSLVGTENGLGALSIRGLRQE